jgi:regulator of RNase E activity RraA
VFPDDIVVVDEDGGVLVPKTLLDEVARAGPEQERLEDRIMGEVQNGAKLTGLYPPNKENLKRYEEGVRKR